jgi:hypothetical protein
MAEEFDKNITLDTIRQALADLRYSVSDFQEIIGEYLTAVDELWREAKSHLASIEARLAGMEVQLSMTTFDQEWEPESLLAMLKDLKEVGQELTRMRQRFHSFTRGTLDRIN